VLALLREIFLLLLSPSPMNGCGYVTKTGLLNYDGEEKEGRFGKLPIK
jgi:hypothetical protein